MASVFIYKLNESCCHIMLVTYISGNIKVLAISIEIHHNTMIFIWPYNGNKNMNIELSNIKRFKINSQLWFYDILVLSNYSCLCRFIEIRECPLKTKIVFSRASMGILFEISCLIFISCLNMTNFPSVNTTIFLVLPLKIYVPMVKGHYKKATDVLFSFSLWKRMNFLSIWSKIRKPICVKIEPFTKRSNFRKYRWKYGCEDHDTTRANHGKYSSRFDDSKQQ